MANPSIRGHQGKIAFFANGSQVAMINLTSVDITQESTFMRSKYVGVAVPEGDQAMDGWTGTVDAEVKDSVMEDFIDALTTANLNGIGIEDYSVVSTQNYNDGTSKSWVYSDMQFKMSMKQEGLQAKITKKLDFQAARRDPVT